MGTWNVRMDAPNAPKSQTQMTQIQRVFFGLHRMSRASCCEEDYRLQYRIQYLAGRIYHVGRFYVSMN